MKNEKKNLLQELVVHRFWLSPLSIAMSGRVLGWQQSTYVLVLRLEATNWLGNRYYFPECGRGVRRLVLGNRLRLDYGPRFDSRMRRVWWSQDLAPNFGCRSEWLCFGLAIRSTRECNCLDEWHPWFVAPNLWMHYDVHRRWHRVVCQPNRMPSLCHTRSYQFRSGYALACLVWTPRPNLIYNTINKFRPNEKKNWSLKQK